MMSVACSKCSAPTKPSNAQKDLTQALQRTLTSEISVKNSNPHAAGAGRLEDPTGLRYAPRPVRWTWGRRPESRDRAKLGSCDSAAVSSTAPHPPSLPHRHAIDANPVTTEPLDVGVLFSF